MVTWVVFSRHTGNHLEKYEFVNGKDDIPYIMENQQPIMFF